MSESERQGLKCKTGKGDGFTGSGFHRRDSASVCIEGEAFAASTNLTRQNSLSSGSSFLSSYRISGVSRKAGLQVVRHDFLLTRSPALSGQWTLLPSASDGFFNH